jgi:putative addiction module component (TIGR02574 family)
MAVTLPLKDMSISEKLQLMEALWEDLSRNADALESPDWHREVLEERESRIASGDAKFSTWEKAKADIRKRVS